MLLSLVSSLIEIEECANFCVSTLGKGFQGFSHEINGDSCMCHYKEGSSLNDSTEYYIYDGTSGGDEDTAAAHICYQYMYQGVRAKIVAGSELILSMILFVLLSVVAHLKSYSTPYKKWTQGCPQDNDLENHSCHGV